MFLCIILKRLLAKYISIIIGLSMFTEYIQAALEKVQYKVIDNGDEPYFADVPELDGVWATGHTVEDARRNFIEALEEWIAARLQWGLLIPPIGGQTIEVSKEPVPVVQARYSQIQRSSPTAT